MILLHVIKNEPSGLRLITNVRDSLNTAMGAGLRLIASASMVWYLSDTLGWEWRDISQLIANFRYVRRLNHFFEDKGCFPLWMATCCVALSRSTFELGAAPDWDLVWAATTTTTMQVSGDDDTLSNSVGGVALG